MINTCWITNLETTQRSTGNTEINSPDDATSVARAASSWSVLFERGVRGDKPVRVFGADSVIEEIEVMKCQ